MKFHQRLRKLREEKQMTQEDLAVVFGGSKTRITNYESNQRKPNIDLVAKMAKFFGVSVDYMLGLTDERTLLGERHYFTGEELAEKLSPELWGIDPVKDLDYIKLVHKMKKEEITADMLIEIMPMLTKFKRRIEAQNDSDVSN